MLVQAIILLIRLFDEQPSHAIEADVPTESSHAAQMYSK